MYFKLVEMRMSLILTHLGRGKMNTTYFPDEILYTFPWMKIKVF